MSKATPPDPHAPSWRHAAEQDDLPATFYADEDDEDAAVEEALGQLAFGQGRPLSEYAEEFNARFAAR